MKAPEAILDLVERFDRNREAYKSDGCNETQLRRKQRIEEIRKNKTSKQQERKKAREREKDVDKK